MQLNRLTSVSVAPSRGRTASRVLELHIQTVHDLVKNGRNLSEIAEIRPGWPRLGHVFHRFCRNALRSVEARPTLGRGRMHRAMQLPRKGGGCMLMRKFRVPWKVDAPGFVQMLVWDGCRYGVEESPPGHGPPQDTRQGGQKWKPRSHGCQAACAQKRPHPARL